MESISFQQHRIVENMLLLVNEGTKQHIIMKKYIFLFIFLIVTICSDAQKIIQMEKDGGVFKIPCVVNGARMKMVFDTGASTVSLSMSIANFLYENDYITKDDIVGKGQSQTADGSIVNHVVINLRDIEIGGLHLKNIEATVIDGQNAPLLLGQSALKQLGSYTINGSSLVLNEVNEELSDEELDEFEDRIKESMANNQYYSAIEDLKKIESFHGLSTFGYIRLVNSFIHVQQYEDAIEAGKKGLKGEDISGENESLLYSLIAQSYYRLKDYKNCIKFSEFSIPNDTDLYSLHYTYFRMGDCYQKIGNILEAERNYTKALNRIMTYRKISVLDVFEGKVYDNDVGVCCFSLAILFIDDHDKTKLYKYATMGAICNEKNCISICEQYGYDFKKHFKDFLKAFKDNPDMIEDMSKQYSMSSE